MKLKSIYIDGLHNAAAKTYQLNDLVYLYGRNGAGKTTVLNAIQLALLGYIPGTAKNSREALLRHAKGDKIVVKLEMDDNGTPISIERSYTAKASLTITEPSDLDVQAIIRDIELPIFNFNDFIGQTANKLKDYFIKNILPTADGELNWEQVLKSGLSDISVEDLPATIKYGMDLISDVSGSPIEQVAQANARFKEEQSFNKSELARLQATIDSMIYYSDYSGPTDLAAIDEKLLGLGAIRDALIRYESAAKVVAYGSTERAKLQEQYEALGGDDKQLFVSNALKTSESMYDACRNKIKELELSVNTARTKRSNLAAIIQKDSICPYTNEPCTGINLADVRQQIESLNVSIEIDTQKIHDLDAEMNELRAKVHQYSSMVSEFSGIKNKLEALERSMSVLPEKPNTDMTVQELDIEIQKYTENKEKLQANRIYEGTIDYITKTKYKAELDNAALTAWVKLTDINGLQTSLTEKPFAELAEKMSGYIQNMYGNTELKAHFNISSKANSFSFGLLRGDKYIPYDQLSSGEKCLYCLALMICITDSSTSPLKLMLCDDMFDHLDTQAVENTFTALKNIHNIQFILAGVKDCQNAKDVMVTV